MNEQMERVLDWLDEEGIPSDYLDEAISRHFNNKSSLIKRLGLSEENSYRQSFRLPTTIENRPLARQCLEDIVSLTNGLYKFLDLSFMWQGKNKVRVGKIMPIAFDCYCNLVDADLDNRYNFNAFREVLLKSINIRNGYYLPAIEDDKTYRKENRDKIIHLLSCYYGDYIKNGRVGWYSANPYDYFTLSGYDCTYTSCVRIGGEYFNSVLHYLESDCMIPYYITEENSTKKIGRCCSYLSNDVIATGRMFGSMFDCDTLVYRDKIQEITGGRWIIKGHVSSDYIRNRSTAYVDHGYGVVSIRSEADLPYASIPKGICLCCGEKNDGEQGGVCSDCCSKGKIRCQRCDERMNEDESYYIEDLGESWCEECAHEYATECERCGRYYSNDHIMAVNDGDLHYCQRCADRRGGIVACDSCNEYFTEDNIVLIEDIDEYVCYECADNRYNKCTECGKYFDIIKRIDGEPYCENCYETIMDERANDEESIEVANNGSNADSNEVAI